MAGPLLRRRCCTSPRSPRSASPSPTPRSTGATTSAAPWRCSPRCATPGVRTLVFSSTAATYGEPASSPDHRVRPDRAHQPVRRHQARRRPHDHRRGGRARTGRRLAALLQRRRRVRQPRRAARPRVAPHPARPPGRARAGARRSPSSATTTRPPTAPASATTSTSPTSPRPTCWPCDAATAGEHLICNLGNGNGFSVREVIETVRKVTGHPVPEVAAPRRGGDPAVLVASAADRQGAARLAARPAPTSPESSPTPGTFAQHRDGAHRRARHGQRRAGHRGGSRELYGTAPEGVWAAPGRVNLIGEHTDYNDGFVMPLALPHTAVRRRRPPHRRRAAAALRPTCRRRRRRAARRRAAPRHSERRLGRLPGRRRLGAARGRATRSAGADIHFDVAPSRPAPACPRPPPWRSSPRSRSNDLYELGLPAPRSWPGSASAPRTPSSACPCGIMDQTASACCTEGHALYLDTRDLTQRQVPFDLAAQGLRLLVVDTRVKHALGDGAYARAAGRLRGGRAARSGSRTLRDVPYDGLDAALDTRSGDDEPVVRPASATSSPRTTGSSRSSRCSTRATSAPIGPVLTAGHASLRDDFRVSCPELDLVVDTANAAGALGARMTGGGFGGSAIVLVDGGATRTRSPRRSRRRSRRRATRRRGSSRRGRRAGPRRGQPSASSG